MDSRVDSGTSASASSSAGVRAGEPDISQEFFLTDGISTLGPFSTAELRRKLDAGEITMQSLVCQQGWPDWKPIADVPEISAPLAPAVTPPATKPRWRVLVPQSPIGRGVLGVVMAFWLIVILAMDSIAERVGAGVMLLITYLVWTLFRLLSKGITALISQLGTKLSSTAVGTSLASPASAPTVVVPTLMFPRQGDNIHRDPKPAINPAVPPPSPAVQPAQPKATGSEVVREYFLRRGDDTHGPFSVDELRDKMATGGACGSEYAWKQGWSGWRKLADVDELATAPTPIVQPMPPPPPPPPPPTATTTHAADKPSTLHLLLKYGTICFCGLLGFIVIAGFLSPSAPTPASQGDAPAQSAQTPPSPPPPPQPLRPEQIAERLRQSTVRIDAGFKVKGLVLDDTHRWLGSGVLFKKAEGSYWILSNAHVVGSDSICNSKLFVDPVVLQYSLVVTMPDGKQVKPGGVLINRHLKDFAVIVVPASTGNYAVLPVGGARLPQGQKVFAMGHPMGLDGTFTSGVISSWRTFPTKLGKPYEVIQTDATINSGNSGGPLVDDFANLIGINTFSHRDAQNLNFAVSAGEIFRSIQAGEMVEFPLQPSQIGPFVVVLNRGGSR